MFCMECHNDLADCTCDDLQERLESVLKGGHIAIEFCAKCREHHSKCKCEKPQRIVRTE